MFEKELDYFITHQCELLQQYRGKILVLKDENVVGAYQNVLEAYTKAQEKYEVGSFMIQPCEPGPEAYTVTISSTRISACSYYE